MTEETTAEEPLMAQEQAAEAQEQAEDQGAGGNWLPSRQVAVQGVSPVSKALLMFNYGEQNQGAPGVGATYELFDGSKPVDSDLGTRYSPVASFSFQCGTLPLVGVNGVTIEALLSACLDQLRGFQKGPFACRENACAITGIEEALHFLGKRTRDREVRGVEGTYQV